MAKKQDFRDRLQWILLNEGINSMEFSRRVGCHFTYPYWVRQQTSPVQPGIAMARKVAKAFGLRFEWVLLGEGPRS